MACFSSSSCPICTTPPEALSNTAGVSGQYVCPAGCTGDITATSEPVVVQILDLSLTKSVYPTCTQAGRTVRYTINVCNRSSIAASAVRVTDPEIERLLDVGTIYINGRPIINGCLRTGILLPGLGAGCCSVIAFDATVPVGAEGTISNVAYAEFEFDNAVCPMTVQTAASNDATLSIATPGLEITKTANRCAVTPDEDVVTFTLTVTNTGSCAVENTVVTDILPTGLSYVTNSTSINGDDPVNLNPATGISLGILDSGDVVTVSFDAQASF